MKTQNLTTITYSAREISRTRGTANAGKGCFMETIEEHKYNEEHW